MANRNFPQSKQWGFHMLPRVLDCSIAIGGTGAPTLNSTTNGIASVTRLAAGTYQLQLADNYLHITGMSPSVIAPVTGGAVNMGSLSAGTVYQIVTLGTSTQAQWVTAGVPSGITAAPGVVFLAAAVGAGNGTVKAIGSSGVARIELISTSPDLMLQNQPFNAGSGGYVTFQTLQAQVPSATTQATPIQYAAADPTSGSTLMIRLYFNDSSVQ